jgi:tetratricopeptide (TPR) repeat protein
MRYFSALLFLPVLLLGWSSLAGAQHLTVAQADSLKELFEKGKPDTSQVNILLLLSNYYGRKTWNAVQNRDSALAMARKAQALSRQLDYARGGEEAVFLEGKTLIGQENMGAVRRLLERVSGQNRVRLLLELGKQRWQDSHAHQADLETSLALFQEAERLSESFKNPQWTEESWFLLGVIYFLKKDIPKSKSYFNQYIEARRRANDKAGEATALLRMLLFLTSNSNCDGDECADQLRALNRALTLSRQMKDKALEVICLIQLSRHYRDQEDYAQVAKLANQALVIQKQIGYPALNRTFHALIDKSVYDSPNLYSNLSNANYQLIDIHEAHDDIDQALPYYLRVVREIEQSGFYEELAYPYALIGNNYAGIGQTDKSIEYYRKSLAVSHAKGEAVVFNGLIRWLTEALLKRGKAQEALQVLTECTRQNLPLPYSSKILNTITLAKCYSALKQSAQAEKYFLEAIAGVTRSPDSKPVRLVKYAAAQFYVATGQYRKAEPLIKGVLARLDKEKAPGFEYREAHLLQFKVDSALGNYPRPSNTTSATRP